MADTIRKTSRKVNFTTVSNDFLQDVNLSWKAKGMIVYILSLPPGWVLNIQDLKNRSKDGRDSTAAGLRELMENGYCRRSTLRSEGGIFGGYDYEVSDIKEFEPEQPETENQSTVQPKTENPKTENPKTENPNTDKPETENTELINTYSNKDSIIPNTNSNNAAKNEFSASLLPEPEIGKSEKEKEKKTLFRNSEVYKMVEFDEKGGGDYSKFEACFNTPEFAPVDLVYYFHCVADWSDQKNMKRTKNGWLATVRNFIRGDVERKKLHLKTEHQAPQNRINVAGAMEYLKDDY